jgi:hypothetical protein
MLGTRTNPLRVPAQTDRYVEFLKKAALGLLPVL